MIQAISIDHDQGAELKPLSPVGGIFDGLVQGRNQASFERVEAIVNDCRTLARVENLAFVGTPSSGKTTTAQRVARALERPMFEGSALNFDGKPHDAFLDILETVHGSFPGWVLKAGHHGSQQMFTVKPMLVFLDEAHDLPPKAQSLFLQLLEKPFRANINGSLIDGSRIMWIFGTTDFSMLQVPLQLRTTRIPFLGYALEEIAEMIRQHSPVFSHEDAVLIARAAKGYPRQAFKIADFLAVRDLTEGVIAALQKWYETDELGLDPLDQSILQVLRTNRPPGDPKRVAKATFLVTAAASGSRVGATALADAQSFLQSLNHCAPLSQASLAEKLQYTDQSDLFRRIVYLESLNLLTRTSRGPKAI